MLEPRTEDWKQVAAGKFNDDPKPERIFQVLKIHVHEDGLSILVFQFIKGQYKSKTKKCYMEK